MSEVRGSSRKELPHVGGQGQWPRGATPRLRSGAVAGRNYSMFKVRRGGGEEIPLVEGKTNPSKTVGVARGIRGQTH